MRKTRPAFLYPFARWMPFLALSMLAISQANGIGNSPLRPDCQPYDEVLERARHQWPRYDPYTLQEEILQSFIAGYNRVRSSDARLTADVVTVFPMHNSDTWYFLAGLHGCFVFWIDLPPDHAQQLMDNGPHGPLLPEEDMLWVD